MNVVNREDLASIIAMIVPEAATSEDALRDASVHAAQAVHAEMPAIRAEVRVWPDTPHVRAEAFARAILHRALALRNDWLAAHGALASG